MNIEFINDKEWGIDRRIFSPLIERLRGVVDKTEGVLNVVFVNNTYIQALNKSYRKKDEPTDVLSFNYGGDSELIGEIYISVDTAKRQAKEYKHTLPDELAKLFVHGFLHIHGYDHETEKEYKIMSKLEEKILN